MCNVPAVINLFDSRIAYIKVINFELDSREVQRKMVLGSTKTKKKWVIHACGFPAVRGSRQVSGVLSPEPSQDTQDIDYGRSSEEAADVFLASDFTKISVSLVSDYRRISGSPIDLEADPLSALLSRKGFTLNCNWSQGERLAWLRSQLIGENQEFVTPFGRRQLVYVDHTATGKSLLFIEDFILRNVLTFYGNTHTDDSYVGKRTSRMVTQSEDYIRKQLGGTSNDALLFCGSGCTAAIKRLQEVMGIAIPSTLRSRVLESMRSRVEERWLVFTGPYEHHSNLLSWRQSLAEVIEIPANEQGLIDMTALEAALESPMHSRRRLKLGAFSACSNVTGLITDTRAIARLLHKHGAFACFDFAASAPHVQIDMRSSEEDGYDAVVLSPHKFLGGPGTPGLLLMRRSLYMLGDSPPSTCGGGTVAYVNGFNEQDTLYHRDIEEREDGGTPPIVGKVRCAMAFRVKDFMGNTMIEHREASYMDRALKRLSAHPKIQILGSARAKRAPILSFLVNTTDSKDAATCKFRTVRSNEDAAGKPLHGRFVVRLLNDLFGIQARGGCACAGPYGHTLLGVGKEQSLAIRSAIQKGYEGLKPGWTRVSLCYSMVEEEVDYVLSAIELVAKYGQRFLALYDLDWHTGNWTYVRANALLSLGSHQQAEPTGRGAPLDNVSDGASQRLRFRRSLRLAKALAHALPNSPPPKHVPDDIDARILLFRV